MVFSRPQGEHRALSTPGPNLTLLSFSDFLQGLPRGNPAGTGKWGFGCRQDQLPMEKEGREWAWGADGTCESTP